MEVGLRVVRGPDWKWGDQDGGEGNVGTIVHLGRPEKTVVVYWDMGWQTNYRVGYDGAYDLRLLDNAPIGVRHANIICNDCRREGVTGLRFRCSVCYDYDLCLFCYMDDRHDINHAFQRFDSATSPGVELPARKGCPKATLKGTFVRAKVRRGKDWEWGDQDGGAGRTGRVLDLKGWDNETWRSVVNVTWATGGTNIYRMGHKGKVDLICVEPASPGSYYPNHLPVLGHNEETVVSHVYAPPQEFIVGERVKVTVDVENLKKMQDKHGGWNPRMAEIVGVLGRVHRVTEKGDIRVFYPKINCRWTVNPSALSKVNVKITVGDTIQVNSDRNMITRLQAGHGEWIPAMSSILGKVGKVVKVYADGDLRVAVEGQTWTLNPLGVHRPGEDWELQPTGLSNGSTEGENHVESNTMSSSSAGSNLTELWSSLVEERLDLSTSMNIHRVMREAAQGHLDVVRLYLTEHPDQVDLKSTNKTCLQVASHQGHLEIVNLLVSMGANVKVTDDEGDTPLHYAAFGNQSEIMEALLTAGANINATNNNSCTALHIAISKKHIACVKVLLKHKPDVNISDNYGDTALHDAIGNDCSEAVQLLTQIPGIDLDLRNKRGFNPLHHAALKGNTFATERLLAVSRQLTDVKKDDGFSALHLACLNGHKAVAEVLVRVGKAEVDLANNRWQTPLMLAVSQGHASVAELLVSSGASLSIVDEDGDTALHMVLIKSSSINSEIDAISSPFIGRVYNEIKSRDDLQNESSLVALAIACFLVEEGSNLESKNKKGKTPVDLAGEVKGAVLLSYVITEQERVKRRVTKNPPVECGICSEMTEENVLLEPCGHRVACVDCSSRLKKCLKCQTLVVKRITADERIVPYKSCHPSADCLRYLETKIAEIEEVHSCTICMERRKNVVFLCGHSACDKCSAELRTCHMCRKTITKKIHLY